MRSNYSREERQKIVEEYIQSVKSQTVFAPEYGIKPNTGADTAAAAADTATF